MPTKRTISVYGVLAALWALIVLWQILEHNRISQTAEESLLSHARYSSNSLGIVIRSLRRFGVIPHPRLQAALEGLAESRELQSVALLNSAGEVVASAGEPMEVKIEDLPQKGVQWNRDSVTVVNLVDLGSDPRDDGTTAPPPVVWGRPEPGETSGTTLLVSRPTSGAPDRPPFQWPFRRPPPSGDAPSTPPLPGRTFAQGATSPSLAERRPAPGEEARWAERGSRGGRRGPRHFRRPPWQTEEEYQTLIRKQGLHGFVLRMSTEAYRAECARDLWLRVALGAIALVAAAGLGVAWRNIERSNRLQMRLLRASEMNLRLKEMNLAAAGLAHETRNPLNIVRALAQMISKQHDTSEEVRAKSKEIAEEVDRVTGRLNEFINYSKPPEPRPAPADLKAVIQEVAGALESDMADKAIRFEVNGPELVVEADESLLRQVLFNLMMNSIQAVGHEGRIEARIENSGMGEASIEVRDDGPGVPPEARDDIFRPYCTTRDQGTGLGLAVVRQIALAHHWEIECVPTENAGARFRLSGLKGASRAG